MKYDVLLADADGTLFDFHEGERIALHTLFQQNNLPDDADTIRLYSDINESHWKKLERGETTQERLRVERFSDFLAAINHQGDAEHLCDQYIQRLGEQRLLLEGAEAFCRAMSEKMPIYLVTNGLSKVQRSRFAGCAIEPYLSGFVISEEIGHQKPEPHMLHEAMQMAGVSDPRHAVLIGDSLTADIGAAKNAGVDSVLFTNGKAAPAGHGATFTAKTLAEAQAWILRQG